MIVVGSHRLRVRGTVSLNAPGVKSSVKKAVRSVRRRVLRGLMQRSASDIASAVEQMAGDGGEAKRLPKRPFHGEVEENSSATMNENVKIKPGKKTPGERRGKENSAAKRTALTGGSAEAKMDQTVIHSPQTREDPSIFFDEDSNHIFPVEQFFGNMDVVQDDYPRRTPGSKRMSRREYRSMHYYAKEDSEDEEL
uniref:Si:ch211-147a11.3 n=1 Tax=Cyprinus carpio carpio TaxID=630221 RepID=A0A9J8CLW2_CYPCA